MTNIKITFDYVVTKDQVLFTLEDQPIISLKGLSGITADIGIGKSQMCEIFAAYYANPKQASKYITCLSTSTKKCLYVDTERKPNDCFNGLSRIKEHSKLIVH